MLILFDIDGTILLTHGAGRDAMADAGRELFGDAFTLEGVEIAGRLDPLIFADAMLATGVAEPDAHQQRFREMYGRNLRDRLDGEQPALLLPGVADLVASFAGRDAVGLGLLTGNYPETGRMKITNAGLDPDVFTVGAWGCDGNHRRDLPPVAWKRYEQGSGRSVPAEQVLIIGDTPHDVDCAAANGCRCLAVATGRFSADELVAAGADRVVGDLADTDTIVDWVLEGVASS